MAETRPARLFLGGMAGVGVGILTAGIALVAMGGGHGSYAPASVLFPYTMLSTRYVGSINQQFTILALLQFPVYGLLISWARDVRTRWKIFGVILAIHLIMAVCAVYGRGKAFSPRERSASCEATRGVSHVKTSRVSIK